MRDQITALAKLAQIDASAREIDIQLQQIPARLSEMKAGFARFEELLTRDRRELGDAESLMKNNDSEVARHQDSIGKAKAKAAKARNSKEADAVERELDQARRSIKDREGERSKLSAAIEQRRTAIATREAEFEKLRTEIADEETAANAKLETLQQERAVIVQGRDAIASKVDRAWLRRYDQLRDKKGSAVAEITAASSCSACRMAIPPQMVIELQREDSDIRQCPHCMRIVYVKSAVDL